MALAKTIIEDVQGRLPDEERYDSLRSLLHAAHDSSNGNAGNIAALSETVGHIAAFMATRDLREDERIKTLFVSLHDNVCPVRRLMTRDAAGHDVMPWESAGAAKPPEDPNEIKGPLGMSVKGPVTRLTVAALFILGAVYLMLLRQDANMRKDLSENIIPAVTRAVQMQTANDFE